MATQYSWKSVRKRTGQSHKGDDQITRWIGIAVLLAIVSHVVVLFAMQKMPIFFDESAELEEVLTGPVVVRSVDDREYIEDAKQEEIEPPLTAEELLSELEMLEEAPKDIEVDFSPDIADPKMTAELEMPAIKGDAFSSSVDMTLGADLTSDVEDLGATEDFIKPDKGQITIDAGIQNADMFDPDKFSKELAKGAGGDNIDGVIKGFTPLAQMTRLSQSALDKAKGMIGSDLLFEFGEAKLRGSAKNSLMKVVLLIDKNPNMYCWIEGHTDLVGNVDDNRLLSVARAQAVKTWLVESMRIDPKNLYVRGFGKSLPIVKSGNQKEQAINRRVEIKMRKNRPPELVKQPRVIKPKINPNIPRNSPDALDKLPEPPAGVIKPKVIKPKPAPPRAVPVEEPSAKPKKQVVPPRAIPVEDAPPVAEPVEPVIPAKPVDPAPPAPPKAIPVE